MECQKKVKMRKKNYEVNFINIKNLIRELNKEVENFETSRLGKKILAYGKN